MVVDQNVVTQQEIIFDADRCTGCRICELVCSMSKHGEYNPKKSFIKLMVNEEAEVCIPAVDIRCDFCGDCVHTCPRNALSIVALEEAIAGVRNITIGRFPIPKYSHRQDLR